jgi:hypothetical protein
LKLKCVKAPGFKVRFQIGSTCAATVRLRTKMKDTHRPFSIPGGVYGVIAMSFAPVCLCLITIMTCSGLCFKMGGAGFLVATLWWGCTS